MLEIGIEVIAPVVVVSKLFVVPESVPVVELSNAFTVPAVDPSVELTAVVALFTIGNTPSLTNPVGDCNVAPSNPLESAILVSLAALAMH